MPAESRKCGTAGVSGAEGAGKRAGSERFMDDGWSEPLCMEAEV